MNDSYFGLSQLGVRLVLILALAAPLAACGPGPLYNCGECDTPVAVSPGPITLTATPQRFPVVTLSDNRDAIVLASGREGDDRSNPVHKFARSYRLEGGVFGAGADLAGTTANTFIASAIPDQSGGGRDSLVSDASGQGLALWTAGNAGVVEMYVNYYLAGFSARELIARPATNVLDHRVAMDGTGNLVVVWRSADGLLRVRDRLGSAALGPEFVLTNAAQSSLGDIAFTALQANVVWSGTNLEVFASRGIGTTWESPVRIGTGKPQGSPARLASHPSAPGFALVAVWEDADGIVFNSRTTAGWQSNTGSRIPGSEGGFAPQVTMSTGGEVMVVWDSPAGIRASRRGSGAFSAAELIGSGGAPRLASDGAGNAIAVWHSGKTIRASRYAVGTGWLGQQDIGGDHVIGINRANVAMDQSGRGVVVWEREVTSTLDPLDTEVAAYAFFAPTARFTMAPNPAAIGAPVTFDAAGSSGNGAPLATFQWDFDNDGTFDATGVNVTTSFATGGARAVRLRVTDAAGMRSDATQTLTVTATTRSLNLQVVGAGGRVTGAGGLDCRSGGVGVCQQSYLLGTSVALQAQPDAGWQFTSWSGDCTGSAVAITVLLDANRACSATFAAIPAGTLTVSVIGSGTVISNPAGIACAPDCTETYALNTVVALTATPAAGFSFAAWSGDADCTDGSVTMSAARSCTATFTAMPPPPSGIALRISANNGSSYAATLGGLPYSWGSDGTGALGNGGADTNVNLATSMGTLTDVRAIDSGSSYGVAARTDGTVWVWGYTGSTFCFSNGATDAVPVRVVGAINAIAVNGGGSHTLILRSDGTVQAFGCNFGGQLGRSGTTPSASAIAVAGLTDITAVSAGDSFSLALKSDGTVWAWGMGPLGDGVSPPPTRFTPMAIPGLNNVIAISAGAQHALALKSDGSVWAWGANSNGKLGDGTEVSRWSPVPTLLTAQIIAISAGVEHSLALRSDGVVLSWGINETGQLGSGSSSPGYRPQPAPVVSLSGVVGIAAGTIGLSHSLAVRSDGSVWSWGYNNSGQLGNGITGAFSTTPVQVVGLSLN